MAKTIVQIIEANNSMPNWLSREEAKVHSLIENSQYVGIVTLFDVFLALFTDELAKHCQPLTNGDLKILLFSECFKRIRISIDLFQKGYFLEGVSSLRTAFELSKGINAINQKILGITEYFGEKRDSAFQALPEEKQMEVLEKYQDKINSRVDNFDDKGIPPYLKPNLRKFKKSMHISVHKSFSNLVMKVQNFAAGKDRTIFGPETNHLLLESAANYISFFIVIFLKNWKNSEFYLDDGKNTLTDLIEFIENMYANMPTEFHRHVIEYIRFKYKL